MSASTVFLLLLVLACPVMMMLMMRGGHGHGGGHAGHGGGSDRGRHQGTEPDEDSTQELRRRRDELDRLIEERERSEAGHKLEPSGSGRR
jgi:Spy/CpxP family protein refolding chaperone